MSGKENTLGSRGPGSSKVQALFDYLGEQAVGVAALLLEAVDCTMVQMWASLVGISAWLSHCCTSGETSKGMAFFQLLKPVFYS